MNLDQIIVISSAYGLPLYPYQNRLITDLESKQPKSLTATDHAQIAKAEAKRQRRIQRNLGVSNANPL